MHRCVWKKLDDDDDDDDIEQFDAEASTLWFHIPYTLL